MAGGIEGSPAVPGVVWGGFVPGVFALTGTGLFDGAREAFFVVYGDGGLAFSEDTVVEGLALAQEGHMAVNPKPR